MSTKCKPKMMNSEKDLLQRKIRTAWNNSYAIAAENRAPSRKESEYDIFNIQT